MKQTGHLRYLALLSLVFFGSAAATTYSQKTDFSPRAVLMNRAMEYTTWHELEFGHTKAPSKSLLNGHVALTGFYQESQNGADLGKYFGIGNGKNSFRVGPQNVATTEVINNFLIHDHDGGGNVDQSTLTGTIAFNPKQEIYGMRVDYFQDINDPFKKFFFKASMPVVHVQQKMGMSIKDETLLAAHVNNDNKARSLQDFFGGLINIAQAADKQGPLTKAKITGNRSTTGIADLNLALGYKLYTTPQNHLYVNAGILIPTGTKKKGEYLFEPRTGNGGHTGFTMGIDGGVELWSNKSKEASVRLLAALDYRYLFESTEYRTPMLNESFFDATFTNNLTYSKFNHYYLGGYRGTHPLSLFPAANVFTQGLKVKPGNQGEAIVDLSFKCSGFVVDLGYNAFYKEKESVWLKNWDDSSFAIVKRDFDASANDIPSALGAAAASKFVTKSDFDMESVTNPSQFSHKIFGGLGYSFAIAHKYFATLGLGASYEFATDNATMEAMALWAKAGFSF